MSFKTYRVPFMVLAGIALSGCATGPAYLPIELRTVTVIPDIRIAKTFYTHGAKELAVEFGAAHIRGDDSMTTTGAIRIGNNTYPGSQNVNTEFTFTAYHLSARLRDFPESGSLGYEVAAGVSHADLNLAASSSTAQGTESLSSPAFRLAGGGMLRVRPTTHLEGNAAVFATNSQFRSIASVGLSLVQRLGSRATIRGGYSIWSLDAPAAGRSAITLSFSGPSIGLGVNF